MASESDGILHRARLLVHPYLRHDVDRGAMLSMTNVLTSAFTSEFHSASPSQSDTGTPPALEIQRGRSQHPLRPIASFPFLIGTGEQCDLRLGGDEIPSLHSVITMESRRLYIECIVPMPPLQIAGHPVEAALLADGATIHIGDFEFRVQHPESALPESALPENAVPENAVAMSNPDEADAAVANEAIVLDEIDEIDERPLGTFSTAELVERLEQDMQLIEQLDEGREAGAEALMDSIFSRAQALEEVDSHQETPEPLEPESLETVGESSQIALELERVLEKMTEFSLELESRSDRQTQREASYAEAAAMLSETQQQLVSQLETLTEQVANMQRPSMPWRASA